MKKKQKEQVYLASHQRSWVWGRHAVCEVLDAQRWPIRELFLAEELPTKDRVTALGKSEQLGATTCIANYDRIRALCGCKDHQGYLARMGPFPYAQVDDILLNAPIMPLYILLDSIRDTYNFGAIIRSSAALGGTAIIAGNTGQAPINGQTVRSSAGAVNRIPIAFEDTLGDTIQKLRIHGVFCISTNAGAELPVWECDLVRPTAFLLGNEGRGISPKLEEQCDAVVSIPLVKPADSLNVSATAAALLYEARRQRAGASGTNHSQE